MATKYLYLKLGEDVPNLTKRLVVIPNLVRHLVWERVVGASSLTLGVTKSFYPIVDLDWVLEGFEASTSTEAAEKLIVNCYGIVKDVTINILCNN